MDRDTGKREGRKKNWPNDETFLLLFWNGIQDSKAWQYFVLAA